MNDEQKYRAYITYAGLRVMAESDFQGEGDFEVYFAGWAAAWRSKSALNISIAERQDAEIASLQESLATSQATQEQMRDTITAQAAELVELEAKLSRTIQERDDLLAAVGAIFVPEALLTIKSRHDNERWLFDRAAELESEKEKWQALRRQIWDAVMQADGSHALTNELYELLK